MLFRPFFALWTGVLSAGGWRGPDLRSRSGLHRTDNIEFLRCLTLLTHIRNYSLISTAEHRDRVIDPSTRPRASNVLEELAVTVEVVAVRVHYLAPCSHEVLNKRVLRVVRCVHFCKCTQLGV